jgi:hypothetical protein
MTIHRHNRSRRFCLAFITSATVGHQTAQDARLLAVLVLTYDRRSMILAPFFPPFR